MFHPDNPVATYSSKSFQRDRPLGGNFRYGIHGSTTCPQLDSTKFIKVAADASLRCLYAFGCQQIHEFPVVAN